jgi:putative ATP-binding cassette transporter
MNRFDRLFWSRLWSLTRPYWDAPTFIYTMVLVVGYNVVSAPVVAIVGYVTGKLMINWRQWLTERFLEDSFRDRAFYRISSDASIDNPDQRISEDLNTFTAFAVSFVVQVLQGLATGVSFIVVLWLISPMLVVVLAACVGGGSLLTIVIGRPLIGINFAQRRLEADFRYSLVGLRNNAEAIAFFGGEPRVHRALLQRLYAVMANFNLLIVWQRNLAFFTYAYDFLLPLVPYLALAPSFFAGTIEFGKITQASAAFITLRTSLSLVIDQFNSLSSFAAVVERLGAYREASVAAPAAGREARIETVEAGRLSIEQLTLTTPDDRRTLVRDLSLEIEDGEALLIVGDSGAGKTSLLRALAGLWRSGRGRIVRPPLAQVMFLPQRPYMILGSLREQLCYPRAADVSGDRLAEILRLVQLESLPERIGGLDAEVRWEDFLSLGEQQQIAFARLLLNRPAYAFLDEATSALDTGKEQALYDCLESARIRVVSVGDRLRLPRYHHRILELLGDGRWRLGSAGG